MDFSDERISCRSEVPISPFSFSGNPICRACNGCFEIKNLSQLARCTRCRVFVYCKDNKECQRKGWQDFGHKRTCKPATVQPPSFDECKIENDDNDDTDVDKPYTFIQLNPPPLSKDGALMTKASFLSTSMGFDEDPLIDLLDNVSRLDEEQKESLAKRWGWPSGCPSKLAVPGYCQEYDGMTLYCVADDCWRQMPHDETNENIVASYVLMISPSDKVAVVRGSAVFFCLDKDNRQVKLTRRDILNICNHNNKAGAIYSVPERVSFENSRRLSIREYLVGMGATTISL